MASRRRWLGLPARIFPGVAAWMLAGASAAPAVTVLNASFEEGTHHPTAWSVSAGASRQTGDAMDGEAFLAVSGSGTEAVNVLSDPLDIMPARLYRLGFAARQFDAAEGTATAGLLGCNRDLGIPPAGWTRYSQVFRTRDDLSPQHARLRLGLWNVRGGIGFDDLSLTPVAPVYGKGGLGAGERLDGRRYTFRAPWGASGLNDSRPLTRVRCDFNSNRWTFGADSEVHYVHEVPGRLLVTAILDVQVNWYQAGELVLEARLPGASWVVLGRRSGTGGVTGTCPAEWFPAEQVEVRMRGLQGAEGRASLQVDTYQFRAEVSGPESDLTGQTRYLAIQRASASGDVQVVALGDPLPGRQAEALMRVVRPPGRKVQLRISTKGKGTAQVFTGPEILVPAGGEIVLGQAYTLPDAGCFLVSLDLVEEGRPIFTASTDIEVPGLYRADYGERLPGSSDQVWLWRASSGHKIPQNRPVPVQSAQALELALARGEVEARQLVVRPKQDLHGFHVQPTPLRGPGGVVLPACEIDVLRVGYVPVERPTDAVGVAAPWPDPLPPLRDSLEVKAGTNQPLWIRVHAPRDLPPGLYEGSLRLTADGWEDEVHLRVEVFGFTLPARMTCQTAFGFSPSLVWRYQGIDQASQRREVLARYWQNFSEHHISPYDWAPLDPLQVRWEGLGGWEGGVRDSGEAAEGAGSLLLDDTSTSASVSARWGERIALPAEGMRLRLQHRTAESGQRFLVSFSHYDAAGQWMSGRNRDILIMGSGSWQSFEQVINAYPPGAVSVNLTLWAAPYSDQGHTRGRVHIDALSLTALSSGDPLVTEGGFEPLDPFSIRARIDSQAWDTAMAEGRDRYGFNTFRVPMQGLGGGTFHARYEPELLGNREGTEAYPHLIGEYLRTLEAHLRDRRLLREAFVYWFDEPDPRDYAFVMNGFRKLKQHAPALRRMLTEQVEDALVGGPDLWCPVSSAYQATVAERRKAAGDRFWWYVCTGPKAPYCTLFIDHPATEMRVWLWQTWQRGIDGILVWQTNYWTSDTAYPDPDRPQNPYADPMGWVSGYSTPSGARRPWGNGDGRFLYPPEAAADARPGAPVLDGPVDSIRWEMLRDGIEDYEYFVILKRLLAERGHRLPAPDREQLESLLNVPEAVTQSMTVFTDRPDPLEAHRLALARAIERLQDAP